MDDRPMRYRVVELRERGLSYGQISHELGIATSGVSYHLKSHREGRPIATRAYRISGKWAATCPTCGGPASAKVVQCESCDRRDEEMALRLQVHRARMAAKKLGYVPSARQLAPLLGLRVSRAGDIAIEAFGRDPLNGGARLHAGPRPWPPREDEKCSA